MGKVANYFVDKARADTFEPTFDAFYHQFWPGYLGHVRTADRKTQLAGIDLVILDTDGNTVTADEKTNAERVHPDSIICELWMDCDKAKPGWFLTGKADWLVVGKATYNNYVQLFAVDKKKLKAWIDANPQLVTQQICDFTGRGGKKTELLLVPWKHIAQFGWGPHWLPKVLPNIPSSSGEESVKVAG